MLLERDSNSRLFSCNAARRLLLPLAATMLLCGCNGCGTSHVKTLPAKSISPDEVLQKMISAYQEAKSYDDQGKVRVEYRVDGKHEEFEEAFAVKLARPNRLSLHVYRLELACDGKQLHAMISDEQTENLNGQVVEKPAPAEISLANLLADAEIQTFLGGGPCGQPAQLELLLGDKPLAMLLSEKTAKQLLDADSFDGHPCYRVEVKAEEEVVVLWIDKKDFVLRRMDYPTLGLIQEIARQLQRDPKDISDVQLAAELHAARLGSQLSDKEFAFAMPEGGKVVRSFMRPPEPLPSPLFGKRPGEFSFTDPEGKPLTQADLAGKIAVLMWFDEDEGSKWALGQLDKVREQFAKEQVSFHAVFADPKNLTSDESLKQLWSRWGFKTPLVRDPEKFGGAAFKLPGVPAIVVLDADGKVQILQPGISSRLETELPLILDRLLKGDDLAADIVRQVEREQAAYHRHLGFIELPNVKIEPWQDPSSLKLTKLWACGEIKTPGNLLVAEGVDGPPRILVNDGWQGVVELDAQGQVAARHELPPQVNASFLRTAVDGEGKRYYIAAASLGQQLHLFDAEWKLLLSYPDEEQKHDGLRDVQLCDLDGDGKLEILVGYWSAVGVQALDLAGQRLWSNRKAPTVLSLVQTPPNEVGFRKLLVTGQQGAILRMNQFGNADPEIQVRERAIHHLYSARFKSRGLAPYVGLSILSEVSVKAIALGEKLEEEWSYQLPEGVFRNQIEYVTSGSLLEAAGKPGGQWILAGANGSIHIVSDDGDFSDSFNSGESLSGIAATRLNGAGVLVVSSDKGVTAWKVVR